MRILVVGTGAIGAFYGGKAAQAGAEVAVVCRSDYDVVVERGIRVESRWGDFAFHPHQVLRSAAEYGGPADIVMVGLKVLPEIDTVALIRPAVGPETGIVLIQNGIGIEQPVAEALPGNEIVSALAFVCCNRVGPGHVRHLDFGRLAFGTWPRGVGRRCGEFAALMEATDVPVEVTGEVTSARWRKLVWNAPFNCISVLGGGVNTREILRDPESAGLVRGMMEEVCALAASEGFPMGAEVIERFLTETVAMEPYSTSMLVDFHAGRAMEVEAILGNPIRIARRRGVPVPRLEALYALLGLIDGVTHAAR